MINDTIDEFNKNCGEIIRISLDVEDNLEFFISNYFCFPQSAKTFLLNDVLVKMYFETKVHIFKKICEKEDINKEIIEKIIEAINFVKEIRNRVAHYEPFVSYDLPDKIRLQERKSVTCKKNTLEVNKEVVKEVEEKRLFSIREINKIYLELTEKYKF